MLGNWAPSLSPFVTQQWVWQTVTTGCGLDNGRIRNPSIHRIYDERNFGEETSSKTYLKFLTELFLYSETQYSWIG